jgi:hypothetical protein
MRPDELTEEKVFEILTWLSFNDLQFAEAKTNVENAEILQRRVRERLFLQAEGTAGERKAEAECSDEAQAADDLYISARLSYEKMKAKRESAQRWYDLYRTLEASRRRV